MAILDSALQLSVAVAIPAFDGSNTSSQLNVMSDGQPMIGAVSSTMAISCSQVLTLPHSSVAVQVLLKTPLCPPQPAITAALLSVKSNSIVPSALQLSVAVGIPVNEGSKDSSQLISMLAAQVISGFVISTTWMICSQISTLPHSSSAVHVLMIVPWCPPHSVSTALLLSEKVIVILFAPLQLSVAVACPVLLGSITSSQLIVISDGQVITGA